MKFENLRGSPVLEWTVVGNSPQQVFWLPLLLVKIRLSGIAALIKLPSVCICWHLYVHMRARVCVCVCICVYVCMCVGGRMYTYECNTHHSILFFCYVHFAVRFSCNCWTYLQ